MVMFVISHIHDPIEEASRIIIIFFSDLDLFLIALVLSVLFLARRRHDCYY